MSLPGRLKQLLSHPRVRRPAEPAAALAFIERSRFVAAFIFLLTVAAIVMVSSAGITNNHLPVLPNQQATVRIVANASFTYESAEKTRLAREELLKSVPPVYRLEFEPLDRFSTALRELMADLAGNEQAAPAELAALVEAFNARGPYRANAEDFQLLLTIVPAERRNDAVANGLAVMAEIYKEGVHDAGTAATGPGRVNVFQLVRPGGSIALRPVQSVEEALTFLRINLAAENLPRDVTLALFRILHSGLRPNLVFDREATVRRQAEAVGRLQPVTVSVARGETIIEPGTRVTTAQYEQLLAHRSFLRDNLATQHDADLQLFGRILLVLAMVLASVFYIRIEDPETYRSNSRLGLLALVVILNLAMVRAVYSLGGLEFFAQDGAWASILPYVAPSALAPLIVAILIDAGSGIFMALFVSIFTGVIYGHRLDVVVVTFLASTVAIFAGREVRQRSRVVRAAGYGGLTVALFALLVGLADQLPLGILLKQMGAGLLSGLFTGIVVVGTLPLLESLFKRTTDITLLELTDFNHPLLRGMQLAAPGSYHHSIIVAQLAESACSVIGANPLLARVCALFHDIGKSLKPEYFTENQRDGVNPHDEQNPSLSALIIKSHVKEGVDLARTHHLPRAVIDVIRQHHGTSLIRFFYRRAQDSGPAAGPPGGTAPGLTAAPVDESTYRYDGPRPRFRESAVICLADAVEAASRSLRKVTPQQVGEMIDAIVADRIADGQLDEAPLTFGEVALIKESFARTLLNVLHARVPYPPAHAPGPAAQA